MRYLICIILVGSLLLSSCLSQMEGNISDRVVTISGKMGEYKSVLGIGIIIDDSILLTSAHLVSDDRFIYSIRTGQTDKLLSLRERDSITDRAMFHIQDSKEKTNITLNTLFHKKISYKNGDLIYTLVSRSGSLVKLDGKITESNGTTFGYTRSGQVSLLSGVVLTDLSVLPGDSGAPVFTQYDELIDVVHVAGK